MLERRIITPTINGNGDQFGAAHQSLTFLVNGDSIGAPALLVDGIYQVRLLSDTVADDFGNFAPGQSLRSLEPFRFF